MLSIDAGRPAPMTYNFQPQQQHPHISRGMSGNGFSSRGKADSIRKISIPSLPTISTSSYDDENENDVTPTLPHQRGSGRSQLLAGLRTAPKTPTTIEAVDPAFANTSSDLQTSNAWAKPAPINGYPFNPHRTIGFTGFQNISQSPKISRPSPAESSHDSNNRLMMGKYMGLPTPPASSSYYGQSESDYESQIYADLLARNISLAQQQQILQQQMRIVQQAQQLHQVQNQMQQLQMQPSVGQPLGTPPISPAVYSPTPSVQSNIPLYGPQNSTAGQSIYTTHQYPGSHTSLPAAISPERSSPPAHVSRSMNSSPPNGKSTSRSPPFRPSPSPSKDIVKGEISIPQKTPSPPSTATGFRRGHKKCSSLSSCINVSTSANITDSGPKTSVPRFSNAPATPVNSTFGGRGDHPIRQPRGPPALEEILARPNSKHEGSKNFSSRQRRRALSKLVNAGIERRGAKPVNNVGSMASVSENDIVLSFDGNNRSASSSPRSDRGRASRSGNEGDFNTASESPAPRNGLTIPTVDSMGAGNRRSALF